MAAPKGNKNAARGFQFRDALEKAMKQDRPQALRKLAVELLDQAVAGNMDAIKEVANRLDGRPGQRVEIEHSDSQAAKMLAAEERLRRHRVGTLSAAIQDLDPGDDDLPAYMQ